MSSEVFCSICGLRISRSSGGFSPYSQHANAEHSRSCGRDKYNAPYHCLRCNFYSDPRRFANKKVCPNCRAPVVRDWEESESVQSQEPCVEVQDKVEKMGASQDTPDPSTERNNESKDGKKRKAPRLPFSN